MHSTLAQMHLELTQNPFDITLRQKQKQLINIVG